MWSNFAKMLALGVWREQIIVLPSRTKDFKRSVHCAADISSSPLEIEWVDCRTIIEISLFLP